MPIRLNPMQRDPDKAKVIQFYLDKTKEDSANMLATAFSNMSKKTAEAKKAAEKKEKNKKKKLSKVILRNTDTVSTCLKLKKQLNAKLSEIYSSTMDDKVKQMLAKDVMNQIMKVEVKIAEIKKREAALREEKMQNKDESTQAKRRRENDIKRRATTITRDYLYTSSDGGLDPNNPKSINSALSGVMSASDAASVTVSIGGGEVSMSDADISAAAMTAAASLEVMV